eukprot:3656721-Prymnesium_polylepis.1
MSIQEFQKLIRCATLSQATERTDGMTKGDVNAPLLLFIAGAAEIDVGGGVTLRSAPPDRKPSRALSVAPQACAMPPDPSSCPTSLLPARCLRRSRPPGLLGEISFLTGGEASATAAVLPGCQFYVWERDSMVALKRGAPAVLRGLELTIARTLSNKLVDANRALVGTHGELERERSWRLQSEKSWSSEG